ncbi:DUF4383 domain-containing protein [Zhihengliuella halotolerans]|uniref:Uncharacterized protein DUF4383 n=1 Tax=Zhihengliuella halotolerans TaxID=370736 RepID=A0A4Q8AEC7_9MICC|nr:DUF4383 domain-containing protein [Zhihengliuella halotolerans]RZU62637.1 uncharacterized protein DUF4383 [Zhihengliuella halotolerans]
MNSSAAQVTRRSAVALAARTVGVVFLLVGVLGFVPGITSNIGDLTFASHHSEAMLLGLFQVSVLHNVVHLLFGVLGIAAGRGNAGAIRYLVWGGVVYLVLGVYGVLVPHGSPANFVPVNGADNVLHFGLGIGMVALGLILGRRKNLHAATA